MAEGSINVRTELDEARVRPFHWKLIVLVFVAILFDGYDILAPSYVIHFVSGPWHLTRAESGFLVSAGLIGVLVGAVSHGIVADRIGRRPTMIGGLLFAGVFTLLTATVANSYGSFVAIRLLTGIGLGVVMPLGTAYINEYLPARSRFRLATIAAASFSVGAVVASSLGVAFTRQYGWQVLFYAGSLIGVVGILFLFVFPESVEFLVARGRTGEAARLLSRVRPERADAYRELPFEPIRPVARSRREWLLPLRRPYLVTTLALWASAFLLLFDNYGLSAWTPNLMVERGEGFALGFGFGGVLHSVPFLGGLVCGYLADKWLGRKLSLVLWCAMGALSSLSLIVTHNWVVNLFAIAAAGFFLIGGQFMLNNTCAMTYPVQARGTGLGYMLGVGRLGAILGPYIGGAVLGAYGSFNSVFVLAALAAALTMISSLFIGASMRSPDSARRAETEPLPA